MTKYIISTMTNSVSYANWGFAGDLPVIRSKVTIKGGANLPSLTSGFGEVSKDGEGAPLWTPNGMITPISDEQYETIKDHKLFKQHIEKGLLKVIEKDLTGNHKAIKNITLDMTARDGYAQLTPGTIKQHTQVKVAKQDLDADISFRH